MKFQDTSTECKYFHSHGMAQWVKHLPPKLELGSLAVDVRPLW